MAADLARKFAHRAAVGDVERHDGHLRQIAQLRRPAIFFHGSASPIQIGSAPAAAKRAHDGLADRRLAVGDQDFALPRIAGHFAQFRIVGQVGPPVCRHRDQHGLPGAVERGFDAHAAWRVPRTLSCT